MGRLTRRAARNRRTAVVVPTLLHQPGHDAIDRGFGQGAHLLVRTILDRVREEERRGVGAECASLCGAAVLELRRRNVEAGHAAPLQIYDVVHTARRAAASIREGFDHRLALHRNLLPEVLRGRLCKSGLAESLDPGAPLP